MSRFTASHAQRYVTALLDTVGNAPDAFKQTAQFIEKFLKLMSDSSDLRVLLASPLVSVADQERAVAAILERGGYGDLFTRFIRVVIRNRRGTELAPILRAVMVEMDRRAGILEATVDTATPLTKDQQKHLSTLLSTRTGATVRLKNQIIQDVIGGVRVRYDDVMIDDTVSGKLARLRKNLRVG